MRRILSADVDEQMPPPEVGKPLSTAEKKLLQDWVAQGAKFENHWAYIPPVKSEPPKVKHSEFVRNDIDRFVLAGLYFRSVKILDESQKFARKSGVVIIFGAIINLNKLSYTKSNLIFINCRTSSFI